MSGVRAVLDRAHPVNRSICAVSRARRTPIAFLSATSSATPAGRWTRTHRRIFHQPHQCQAQAFRRSFSASPALAETDLLVDGGFSHNKGVPTVRNAASLIPPVTTFRVNGAGYRLRSLSGKKNAGLDGMEGLDITRCHSFEGASAPAIVKSTARSKNASDVLFEQILAYITDFRRLIRHARHTLPEKRASSRGVDKGDGVYAVRRRKRQPDCVVDALAMRLVTSYIRRSQLFTRRRDGVTFQWAKHRLRCNFFCPKGAKARPKSLRVVTVLRPHSRFCS